MGGVARCSCFCGYSRSLCSVEEDAFREARPARHDEGASSSVPSDEEEGAADEAAGGDGVAESREVSSADVDVASSCESMESVMRGEDVSGAHVQSHGGDVPRQVAVGDATSRYVSEDTEEGSLAESDE